MADYYPLIARAIEGLSDQSPQMRRAVYERARAALLDQLHALEPPLEQADIHRERLSLDDAIGKVDALYEVDTFEAERPHRVDPAESSAEAEPEADLIEAELPGAAPEPVPAPSPALPPALPAAPASQAAAPVPSPLPAPKASATDDVEDVPFEPHVPEEEPARAPYTEDGPARPRIDSRSPALRSTGRGRTVVLGVVLALVIGAIAVAAWMLRDTPGAIAVQPQLAEAPPPPAPEPESGKLDDRVGGGPPLPSTGQPGEGGRQEVGVAQRAIYYEEDTANPQRPREIVGRAVWRLEGINAGPGQPLETAVRAVVEFPEAGLTMNLLMRRNLDQTLPASHTVELNFSTQGDAARVVRDVGLLQFKNDIRARGTPVAGLPVPVRENLFLIGLSNLSTDVERNIELLLNRNWIDLPIRMVSGQRAIISFEKGVAGEQVMNDAFRQWQ